MSFVCNEPVGFRYGQRLAMSDRTRAMAGHVGLGLIEGNLRFQREVFEPRRAAFEQLIEGQTPRALYVGCSDSRVVAELILDVAPGELFVVRNIGAIVPHSDDLASTSLGAAIDYAIHVLQVPDIVVCGHDLCGGLRAIVDGTSRVGSHLERWLRKGSSDVKGFDLLDHVSEMSLEELVERFVSVQVDTLGDYDVVVEARAEGRLHLHGAVYDPRTGKLRIRQDSGGFREVSPVEARASLLPPPP
jgi:carbonic anhydrase